ncbi:MAG TPA: hypothetical protein VLW85_03665 [Myxococcales bacterium]|nr:hypothetical protein [Myxococcales bacterium]
MRRAAATCALLVAGAARADFTVSGGLGAGATRSDSWSTGAPVFSQPGWDWNADLAVGGSPLAPGLMQFLATGQYRSLWAGYPDGSNSTRGLGYGLNLSLLSATPLPVTLSATRALGQFSTDTTVERTGSTLATAETGAVVLRAAGYPNLRASLTRTDFDNESFGAPRTTAGSTLLSLGASHSNAGQELSASYDTSWNDGTYAETNYRSHALQALANTTIADGLVFRLADRYFLRLPTQDLPGNPRYDDNTFDAGLQWRPGQRLTSGVDYGFHTLLITAPGTPDLQQQAHIVRANAAYQASEELTLYGLGSVQSTAERQDGISGDGESALAGGGINWRHPVSPAVEVLAGGSATAGAAKSMDTEVQPAYGAGATLGVNAAGETTRGSATYNGAYEHSTTGLSGWSLTNQLNLSGDWAVGATLLRATALLSDSRREDLLLGSYRNRAATLTLTASWGSYGLQAVAGQTDGASQALAEPGATGLILPTSYNTRTRYATLFGGLRIPGTRVVLTALARTLSTEAPGVPIRHENGGDFTASYAVGAMTFSLEERFTTGGSGGLWSSGNIVMVRAMRTFGGRL